MKIDDDPASCLAQMNLYLDTSALVKLYVPEPGSGDARRIVSQATRVGTSRISYVEARAAFARRRREGALSSRDYGEVLRSLEHEWESYVLLEVTASIIRAAGDLTEQHALRAYDAIHLATALSIPPELTLEFLAADERLIAAAAKEGLAIQRLPA